MQIIVMNTPTNNRPIMLMNSANDCTYIGQHSNRQLAIVQ